jgi:protein SCO1/2/putative membrane protein
VKERLLWGAFILVLACAVAAVVGVALRRGGEKLDRVPEFSLVERSGRPLTPRDLLGRVWVAQFIFTRCAGSCPLMVSRMHRLWQAVPGATYVSFTVDPEHDTPEVLRAYVKNNSLPEEWLLATGTYSQMQSLAKEGFHLSMSPADSVQEPIIHSDRLILVDPGGRIRGTYPASEEDRLAALEKTLRRDVALARLPALNAGLNALSALLLTVGFILIKRKRVGAHRAAMLAALGTSTLFLISYLTAHHYLGSTPYQGEGWSRPLYFSILISHTVLAALIVPLAILTLYRAFRGQFERHRKIAWITLPAWFYVSITGVIIYFMLYRR